MKRIFNPQSTKNLRQTLRKNQTVIESLLWGQLRGKRFYGLKFFRQFGVGKYILDFYCFQYKIAIEVDGSHHAEEIALQSDAARTQYLDSYGIKVFRVWNNDVTQNMQSVLDGLYYAIFEGQPPLAPPSIQGGEAPRLEPCQKATPIKFES